MTPDPTDSAGSAAASPKDPPPTHRSRIISGVQKAVRWLFGSKSPRTEPTHQAWIGTNDQTLRVLAFAGGGLDTVMQLGVTHALLVSKAQAPDVVSGVSAGAVNAVALAEILQAGRPDPSTGTGSDGLNPAQRLRKERVAQIRKFREVFEASLALPAELMGSSAPDPYEVNARAPLRPQELPIHKAEERHERALAAGARFGLVRLLNSLLAVRLHISTLTVGLRRALELVQLKELPLNRWSKFYLRTRELTALWWLVSTRLVILSPLLFRLLLGICLGGSYRKLLEFEERMARTSRGEELSRFEKTLHWFLARILRLLGLWRADTAKQIITQSKMKRCVTWVLQYALGISLSLWLFLPVFIIAFLVLAAAIPILDEWRGNHPFVEIGAICLFILPFGLAYCASQRSNARLIGRVLASFDLEADFLTPFFLKTVFVRHFDRDYYGKCDFKKILSVALTSRRTRSFWRTTLKRFKKPSGPKTGDVPSAPPDDAKRLSYYVHQKGMPIYVAPAVANIARTSGIEQIEVAGLGERVVDALLAACAVTPLFRAQRLEVTASATRQDEPAYYIDAANIANDPSFVILRQLRRIHQAADTDQETIPKQGAPRQDVRLAKIKGIEVYPVAPFPVEQGSLEPPSAPSSTTPDVRAQNKTYSSLVQAVFRALHLKRFQDARLERKFIHLYSRALPENTTFFKFSATNADGTVEQRVAAAADVHPIETERALNLNVRVLGISNSDARRDLVAEAVAEGCRTAMQVFMAASIQHVAKKQAAPPASSSPRVLPCREVVLHRLGGHNLLPGSADEGGPGLPEVCRHCRFNRASTDSPSEKDRHHLTVPILPANKEVRDWPVWTDEYTRTEIRIAPFTVPAAVPDLKSPNENAPPLTESESAWPRQRSQTGELVDAADKNRPTVSFLFSGGVFRGVFQVGVVNALAQAGIQPDLLAGASVGTITSAMVGSVFTQREPAKRQKQIARLAAVFLAIDRLVLTDRFADFIRRFTLRAAEARFSLRDADHLFRRFDQGRFGKFNKRARRVTAGLERLFDLNPFELVELTKAMRSGDMAETWRQLSCQVGQFLDRYGVSQEILGAEPLDLLIREVVMSAEPQREAASDQSRVVEAAEFDVFLRQGGIHMLATTTNLTRGRAEILSSLPEDVRDRVLLKEGLLASSAFPAVFRPRWSWEVFPQTNTADKLVDGGVMDNLPVDAVVSFLWRAYKRGLIKLWPQNAPHLIFTASLQVRQRQLLKNEIRDTARDWMKLRQRAKRLSYNQKIDRFAGAQQNFRAIARQRAQNGEQLPPDGPLLNMEVVVVKPEWLVGTFSFHPMLGFRRRLQAASIAHGCAATLAELQKRQNEHSDWTASWGLKQPLGFTMGPGTPSDDPNQLVPRPLTKGEIAAGKCWFRDVTCPFSEAHFQTISASPPSDDGTMGEIDQIYRLCGQKVTHSAEAPVAL